MQTRARKAYVPQDRRNALFELEREEDLLHQINMYGKPCARWRQTLSEATLLHRAIKMGWFHVCQRLIVDFHADVNASAILWREELRNKCIHWAVSSKNCRLDIVQLLHAAGANLNEVEGIEDVYRTPLEILLAHINGNGSVVRKEVVRWMLTQASLDLPGPRDAYGKTALDVAFGGRGRNSMYDEMLAEMHRRANP
jgi:hypothetical protein